MTVIVDVHEKGGVKDEIRQRCSDFEVRDGFGCDYIAGPLCIERKRWEELPERMTNNENDLYAQLYKTANAAEALGLEPALLLEGEVGRLDHTAIPMENILKYLHGVYKLGITVLFSVDRGFTAELLEKLDDGSSPSTSGLRDPEKVAEGDRGQYLLEGLPRVGPSTALDLLEHFGSAGAVFAASEEELREVDGVGPATAGGIVSALEEGPP